MFYCVDPPLSKAEIMLEAERIVYHSRKPLSDLTEGIELWTTFLFQRGFSRGTIYQYRRHVKKLLAWDSYADLISIESHISQLRESGLSNSSLGLHIQAIKNYFDFLESHNLWPDNPARHVLLPKRNSKERAVPSIEDMRRLLSLDMTPKDRLILHLFLDTGFRLSELTAINIDHIDMVNQEITVIGKGSKQRTVPISPSICQLLDQYIPDVMKAQEGRSVKWLFPARRGDNSQGHVVIHSMQRRLSDLCNRAAVGHFTPHQLRHFFATYQIRDGADIKAVSKMLGHASVATTLNIYHHVDRDEIKRIHDEHSPLNIGKGEADD